MEALGITGVEAILLIGGVMGFVELIKKLFEKDWRSAIIIFGSGLVGGLLSLFPEMSFSVLTGIVGGLTASGIIKISQDIGKKSEAVNIEEVVTVSNKSKK